MKDAWQWVKSLIFVGQIYLMMAVISLVFAPWALFSTRGANFTCKAYSRWVFWTAKWMVGLNVEFRGIPPTEECIVAGKHQSFLDVMMIFYMVPRGKFIMKHSLLYTPFIGQYGKKIGCIPVRRGERAKAIQKMMEDVKNGEAKPGQLIIYPQGTRIKPGVKAPYKVGTAVLYQQMEQPVYPVATNAGLFWPRKGIMRRPGTAIVECLDPIMPGLDKDTFTERLENAIETRSNELMREGGYDPDSGKEFHI